jgi:pimeloyl-ACP methyl ester carboxylesterase
MALDAIDFIDALEVGEVDLLGFSIGSFVAQEIALVRPSIVRNLVLASSARRGRAECTVGRPR